MCFPRMCVSGVKRGSHIDLAMGEGGGEVGGDVHTL
jgi:hypothetical protein